MCLCSDRKLSLNFDRLVSKCFPKLSLNLTKFFQNFGIIVSSL